MTVPITDALLPTCVLYVDGVRFADGQPTEDPLEPVALDDLHVVFGRNNSLDQPDPGTCTFRIFDAGGGARFVDRIHIGSAIQVQAEATIFPDPTVPIFGYDAGFEGMAVGTIPPSTVVNGTARVTAGGPPRAGTRAVRLEGAAGILWATFPPAAYGSASAWDQIPRTKAGQTWQYGLSALAANAFGLGQRILVRPVAFTAPNAGAATPLPEFTLTAPYGTTGWSDLLGDFEPPAGVWLGLQVEVQPAGGPSWDDVPASATWDSLGGAGVLTNLVENPSPGSVTNWRSNISTSYANAYSSAEGVITVERLAPVAGGSTFLTSYALGNATVQPTLPAGAWYQRSVEVWLSAPGKTSATTNGFPAGLPIPGGQWYRLVDRFQGSGAPAYVMNLGVVTADASALPLGIQSKLRHSQLVPITGPTADTVPYFDGSTPDAGGFDYAWSGTANASTSTATDTRTALVWDDLGVVHVDALKLLAPATGALRAGTVFAGRVTDLEAAYDLDLGGTVIECTGQTHLAELDNRYVGDVPWLAETLAARFAKIVTASGQQISYQIDPTVQGKQVTWRDVDSQPSGDLLHQLAQSVGGALWSAATASGDAYVWLEDIDQRPAMSTLQRDPDLVVRIKLNATIGDGTRSITLDACDVLLEPLTWLQTTEDDATRVVVTWQEQTLDTEGKPKPTSRDYIADNPNREALTGRRRVQTSTQLANLADAQLLGDSLMARVSSPGWRVAGLTLQLELMDRLDAATLDRVMKILDGVTRLGLGILLTNVPEWAPPMTGEDVWLFLEGAEFTNQAGVWRLELLTSSGRAQGESTVRWDDLPGSVTPAATRTNRATNPRAVTGGTAQWGQAGWGTGGNGTTSYITGVTAPTGTNISTAFRKSWTTAASSATAAALALTGDASNRIPVTAGKTYTVTVYVRHNSIGTKNYEILLRWFNQVATSGSAQVGADQIGAAVAVADGVGWTRLTITVTAPAGALSMNIYPRLQLAATGTIPVGATQDGTGLLIEEAGSAGGYFDGATADAPPLDYAWSGTANASTSTATDTTTPVTGWTWDQFDPAITWNDLHGVGI